MIPDIHTHNLHAEKWSAVLSCDASLTDVSEISQNRLVSTGWHPWYLNKSNETEIFEKLNAFLLLPNVVAIGETGLDRLCKTNFEYQKEIFLKHIILSESLKKPLIIHCVRAFNELVELKKQTKPCQQWIVHGFNNRMEIAKHLRKAGIRLSFGKALLNSASNASKVIAEIPPAEFFLETDDSGVDIASCYQKAALYCHVDIENLIEVQMRNFKNLFFQAIV